MAKGTLAKASLLAEKLKKTFSEENNDQFTKQNQEKIDKFFDNDEISQKYKEKTKKIFTENEINKAIARINQKNSTDMYGISNFLLKKSNEIFKAKMLELFNKCLTEEDFSRKHDPKKK